MKITLQYQKTSGSKTVQDEVVCGDDSNGFWIGAYLPTAQIQVDAQPHPRAESIEPFGRGNRAWSHQWTAEKTHATQDEAYRWRIDHAESATSEGTLIVVFPGGATYRFYGVMQSAVPVHRNLSTTMQYQFISGDPI